MACGICGGTGHNRRTCSAGGGGGGGGSSYGGGSYSSPSSTYSFGSASRYSPPTTRRTVTCGDCGQQGHNIRACTGGASSSRSSNYASSIATSSSYEGYGSLASTTSKRTVSCSGCGQQGHNIRTCTGGSSSSRSTSSSGGRTIFKSKETSTPTRTVTCGICGKSGHNSRACTGGSSSSSISSTSISSTRTVTCGLCGRQGHNRRTCTVEDDSRSTITSSSTSSGSTRTCGICGQTGHNRRTCTATGSVTSSAKSISSTKNPEGTRVATCGSCGERGHNRRTCKVGNSSGSLSSGISKTKTATCGTCGEPGHNRRTCKLRSKNDSSRSCSETTDDREESCGARGTGSSDEFLDEIYKWLDESQAKRQTHSEDEESEDDWNSTASHDDHGYIEDKKKEVLNKYLAKYYETLLGKMEPWMDASVEQKLLQGPSDADKEGQVYLLEITEMNSFLNISDDKEGTIYHIGGGSGDPEETIGDMEQYNDETYDYVGSPMSTPFCELTKDLVYLQLKKYQTVRDGEAPKEWFTGDGKKFQQIIENFVKLLKSNYENLCLIRFFRGELDKLE